MTKHTVTNILALPSLKQRVFWVLVAACAAALSLYMYFIAAAIVHVVMYEETAQDIADANTRVSNLEAQYLASANTLTAEYASVLGLTELAGKTYAVRGDTRVADISFSSTQQE